MDKSMLDNIKTYCIYEGDEFETEYDIETAVLKVTKFNTKFENINSEKIKGAFAVVLGDKGPIYTEIMNINQIKGALDNKISSIYTNFAEEMAKNIVIERVCRIFANTKDILLEAPNSLDSQIKAKANQQATKIPAEKEEEKLLNCEVIKEKAEKAPEF